ncbi:YHYH protein [Colwellia echini]|uniref:YHYH protein n=1 Tax=Colwellia echini TaxID=1982103 RepID=UPI001FE54E0A|nr:YHYH protein [Colwellia echini]
MNNTIFKVIAISLSIIIASCGGNASDDSTSNELTDTELTDTELTDSELTDEGEIVLDVDATLFLTGDDVSIDTVSCTLTDATETLCYEITSNHIASEHDMGPWCPETIYDTAEKGGLWFDNGEINDLDGPFILNLATYYNDSGFKMYDDDGNVRRMETAEQCELGADPNIEDEFKNMCAQCLPEWVSTQVSYLIPITPRKQDEPVELSDGPTLEVAGVEYGPSVRGLAFNGVRFDHPADIDIILAGYQIAPVDDAGGHVNNSLGYHYHGDTGMTTRIEQSDDHSAMIGYALDGHGLYAKLDDEGNEATELDECRGHSDDTRGYHYHVMSLDSNEFLDCFYGAWAETEEEDDRTGPPR